MTRPNIDFTRSAILIELALAEDLGTAGDTTSKAVIPPTVRATALLRCKEDLICAGLPVAEQVFRKVCPDIEWTARVEEGDFCRSSAVLAEVKGPAQALLTAERTALNFLQRLCGIASTAEKYAKLVKDTKTRILDTRKTTPGWRNLEKYAVAVGGADNHRIGLFDRIMIKDNHRELAGLEGSGGIARSIARAREMYPGLEVEAEADTVAEAVEAMNAGADYVLFDNMNDAQMAEAVKINRGRCKLEASGGITLERIKAIAGLGIDFISVGALTHSVRAADISMEIKPAAE
ncbi:MAG: carboxylating nicotinate-nucleotide diphosphorylase [Victivallales bacterium]|nr:carboxylating nicotinate-nucleotide diphosphorylase [Victivallales bacterium]